MVGGKVMNTFANKSELVAEKITTGRHLSAWFSAE